MTEPEAVPPVNVDPASDLQVPDADTAKQDDLADRVAPRPVPIEPLPLTIAPMSAAREIAGPVMDNPATSSAQAAAAGQPAVQRLTEAVPVEPLPPTLGSDLPPAPATAVVPVVPATPVVARLSSQRAPLLRQPEPPLPGPTGQVSARPGQAAPSVQKLSYQQTEPVAQPARVHDQPARGRVANTGSGLVPAVGSLLEPVQRWSTVSVQAVPTRDAVQPLEPLSAAEAPSPPEPLATRGPLPVVTDQLAPMGDSDYTPLSAVSFDRPAGSSLSVPSVPAAGVPNVQRTTTTTPSIAPTPPSTLRPAPGASAPTPAMPIHVVQPSAVQPAAAQHVTVPAVASLVQPMARSTVGPDSDGAPVSFATMFGPATSSVESADLPVQRAADDPVPAQDPGQPPPAPSLPDPAPSQPSVSAVPASASAGSSAGGGNLDELARRMFEPLSARLKAELWLDRERAGLITDVRT